jgi:hypothetical protein
MDPPFPFQELVANTFTTLQNLGLGSRYRPAMRNPYGAASPDPSSGVCTARADGEEGRAEETEGGQEEDCEEGGPDETDGGREEGRPEEPGRP